VNGIPQTFFLPFGLLLSIIHHDILIKPSAQFSCLCKLQVQTENDLPYRLFFNLSLFYKCLLLQNNIILWMGKVGHITQYLTGIRMINTNNIYITFVLLTWQKEKA
jgi:hypothetical protein